MPVRGASDEFANSTLVDFTFGQNVTWARIDEFQTHSLIVAVPGEEVK